MQKCDSNENARTKIVGPKKSMYEKCMEKKRTNMCQAEVNGHKRFSSAEMTFKSHLA